MRRVASREIGHDAGFVPLIFDVIGTDVVTTGNGLALPDLAPSTNASSSAARGECVAGTMAQDPTTEKVVRLVRVFRISHGIQWMAGTLRRTTLRNWLFCNLSPPAPTSPAWPAQTLLLLPLFIIYTHLSPLSDLFDDLFRSLLPFLCASTCYIAVTIQNITEARNIEISFDNLILVSWCWSLRVGELGPAIVSTSSGCKTLPLQTECSDDTRI
jgi:hypothetical protein